MTLYARCSLCGGELSTTALTEELQNHLDRQAAEIERLRAALREARQYVDDAGCDEDSETQKLSAALLAEIDSALGTAGQEARPTSGEPVTFKLL